MNEFACPRPAGVAVLLAALSIGRLAAAEPLMEIRNFGTNPGKLAMYVSVPEGLAPAGALVVVAHGCLQTAQEMAEVSGWDALARAHRFAVVYPQTSRENDPFAGCFRTWLPEHQQRDAGEPLSVIEMVRWMLEHEPIDPRRVYITGMSSGGHLTNVMLATYPDVFAAGAPQSSFPYKCAVSFADVEPCCKALRMHSREEWGALARSGFPGYAGVRPKVAIWHGRDDALLVVANLDYQVQQWTAALDIDAVPDGVVRIGAFDADLYADASGSPRLEAFAIPGLGHAIALDAKASEPKCGVVGQYASDVGICAAEWIGRWFGVVPKAGDVNELESVGSRALPAHELRKRVR
jgi:poly(hydroxyalkanoate) depolymerase family esterase